MNRQNNQNNSQPPDSEDDFSASMAKLAELASKDLGPDKPKDDNTVKVDDELLKEFMKPKRRAKPKNLREKLAGKTIKLKINPYVLSGVMIIILSGGIIAAPRISQYYKEKEQLAQEEKIKAEQIANNTDDKLKTYSVFDAAKDVSNGKTDLKVQTVSELVQSVEEGNLIAARKEEENRQIQLAMNTLSLSEDEINISLLESENYLQDEMSEDENTEISLLDPANYQMYWDLSDISDYLKFDFSLNEVCTPLGEDSNWENGLISGKICS